MDKNLCLVLVAIVVLFISGLSATVYSTSQSDKLFAEVMSKSTNPIAARCAFDAKYTQVNQQLCMEALKK